MNAAIAIEGVTKRFPLAGNKDGVLALSELSLAIAPGEFVAILGPSGCGKSTLLRMIAGLEQISAGEVRIGAQRVNELPPKQRDIAMVFQNYALYPHMTVRDNMSFALMLAKTPKDEVTRKVDRAAGILGLGALLDRYPRQLSGGQRQRVAMGRAIVRDPQVFLFDEPLSNLDAKLRVAMRIELKELHQRLKTTSIYVTHDQIEAMTMADKIVVMRDGVVEQTGDPLDLYDHPANTFVAGFIGSPAMNMIPGTARMAGGAPRVEFGDGVALPLPEDARADDGQQVLYGLRPEHCALGASGLYTFRRVTLPLIRPAVLAGGFLAFMSSFDNISVSLFLRSAGTDLLPIRMWQDVESQLDVRIAAVSTLLILLTVALMLIMEQLAGLSQRMR